MSLLPGPRLYGPCDRRLLKLFLGSLCDGSGSLPRQLFYRLHTGHLVAGFGCAERRPPLPQTYTSPARKSLPERATRLLGPNRRRTPAVRCGVAVGLPAASRGALRALALSRRLTVGASTFYEKPRLRLAGARELGYDPMSTEDWIAGRSSGIA